MNGNVNGSVNGTSGAGINGATSTNGSTGGMSSQSPGMQTVTPAPPARSGPSNPNTGPVETNPNNRPH